MRSAVVLLSAALAAVSSAVARSSTGDRVLVVLESQVKQDDYSKLWASLKSRGFELTFKDPKDGSAELIRHGETQYDHLIMYAPSTKSFATSLQPKAIVAAQFAGINTLYLLSSDLTEFNREALREYDVEFTAPGTAYLDGFKHVFDSAPSQAYLDPAVSLVRNGPILTSGSEFGKYRGPIVYPSGAAHVTGENAFLIDVLEGSRTSYTGKDAALDADEAEVDAAVGKANKEAVLAGKSAKLVSAMQTRDNVRIGFVGSGEMFSDKWWESDVMINKNSGSQSSNALFADDLTKWIFQETGVVKVVATHHRRAGETEPRELYTKKDDLTFTLTLSQHTTTANGTSAWTSFDASDLQLDFTMLDPHVRTALVKDPAASTEHATTYKAQFKAPDRHGVFKFVVEYWRPGWSYIRSSSTASVVPLRHDEYAKFTTGAWPYYASTLSVSGAFVLFCVLWLAIGEEDRKGKKKAE